MPELKRYIEVHAQGLRLFCLGLTDVSDQRGLPMAFAVAPFAVVAPNSDDSWKAGLTIVKDVRCSGYVSFVVNEAQCDKAVLAALQKLRDELEALVRQRQIAQGPTPEEVARMKAAEKRIELAR